MRVFGAKRCERDKSGAGVTALIDAKAQPLDGDEVLEFNRETCCLVSASLQRDHTKSKKNVVSDLLEVFLGKRKHSNQAEVGVPCLLPLAVGQNPRLRCPISGCF